jgi:hypothetical protein
MGVFNLLETIFFLSLAITFILIFMLVNHFKQRLSTIENKCNTMFEIINNLVQELGTLKQIQMYSFNNGCIPQPPLVSKTNPEVCTVDICDEIKSVNQDKIVVSDDSDEDEYEDDDGEYSDEDDAGDEPDIENDDDDNSNKIKIVNMDVNLHSIQSVKPIEQDGDIPSVLGTVDSTMYRLGIKEVIDVDQLPEIYDTEDLNFAEDLSETHLEDLVVKEDINIDKIADDITNVIVKETIDNMKEDAKDVYNKMSVQELKKLVITKGLCSDASKLKKNDLLKLLEIDQ